MNDRGPDPTLAAIYARGGRVGVLRYRMRLTQPELARLVGVSRATVARWERGTADVPPWHVELFRLVQRVPDEQLQAIGRQLEQLGPVRVLLALLVASQEASPEAGGRVVGPLWVAGLP